MQCKREDVRREKIEIIGYCSRKGGGLPRRRKRLQSFEVSRSRAAKKKWGRKALRQDGMGECVGDEGSRTKGSVR